MQFKASFIAFALAAALPAMADNLSLNFTDADGGGSLSMNAEASFGSYLITSASGTIHGLPVVSLVAPGVYPDPSIDTPNDNLLYFPANPTYLDFSGISFLLFGGAYVDLFSPDNSTYAYTTGVTPILEDPPVAISDLSVTQTGPLPPELSPEPSSLLLLGFGLAGVGTIMRRRLR